MSDPWNLPELHHQCVHPWFRVPCIVAIILHQVYHATLNFRIYALHQILLGFQIKNDGMNSARSTHVGMRDVYKILIEKPVGIRPLGYEVVDRIKVAQNMVQWQSFVDTVMNILAPRWTQWQPQLLLLDSAPLRLHSYFKMSKNSWRHSRFVREWWILAINNSEVDVLVLFLRVFLVRNVFVIVWFIFAICKRLLTVTYRTRLVTVSFVPVTCHGGERKRDE